MLEEMTDPDSLPSARVRARRLRRRRARIRGAVILGGGSLLVIAGVGAGASALAQKSDPDTATALNLVDDSSARSDTDDTATPVAQADALSAASGSLAAGESVTITGSGLENVTRVVFGTQDATIASVAAEAVTVTVPTAVNYVSGAVAVSLEENGTAVAQETPLSYTYEALTGVDRQLEYALAHWNNYNTAQYGDYNSIGGDCMNFVSQTLEARGWAQRSDWYNNGTTSTENWRYVPTFSTWITANATELGATKLTVDQRDQIKLGDLVLFDWNNSGTFDHIQVASAIVHNADGSISIKMVGHNTDSDYRDLDEAITVDHPGASVTIWSLPDA